MNRDACRWGRRPAILVCAVGLALGACSRSSGQLSFVGPQVEGIREFHVVTIDDGERVRLMSAFGGLGSTLVWLPDGKQAVVYREAERDYYLAEVERGSLGECLSCGTDGLSGPAVSPDGKRIAWSGPEGVYLQDLPDGELTKLADVARPGWLSWSPDGGQLAFAARVGTLQVYRIAADSGEILQLTHAMGEPAEEAFAPAWSPRADQIAYHSLDGDGLHLMSIPADGGEAAVLADWTLDDEIYDPGLQAPPVWSPDGGTLLFAAAAPAGGLDLFAVGADGRGLRNLTNAPGDDWDPAWSPDGEWIAFTTDRDGDQEVYVMQADGSGARNVSQLPTTPESNPAWRP